MKIELTLIPADNGLLSAGKSVKSAVRVLERVSEDDLARSANCCGLFQSVIHPSSHELWDVLVSDCSYLKFGLFCGGCRGSTLHME